MSFSQPDGAPSPSTSPLASPPPKIDTNSQQRPRPRPKLVSFGRESLGGGRPNTEGRPQVDYINEDPEPEPRAHAHVGFRDEVTEHSPFTQPGKMSREMDPLLKEAMSPIGSDDDWLGEHQTEETKSSWFLFLLTFGGLGLQIGWSVETSNGSVRCPVRTHSHATSLHCIALPALPWHQQGHARPRMDRRPALWRTRPALCRSQKRQL